MDRFVECMGAQPIGWRLPNTSLYWYCLLDWDIFQKNKIPFLAWEVRVRVARGKSVILAWQGKEGRVANSQFNTLIHSLSSWYFIIMLNCVCYLLAQSFSSLKYFHPVGWQRCRNHTEKGTWGVVTVYISKNQSPFTSSHRMSLPLFYFVFKKFPH